MVERRFENPEVDGSKSSYPTNLVGMWQSGYALGLGPSPGVFDSPRSDQISATG